ncbi:high affinity methionine permease, partial [Histoplasma capsulatum]
MPSDEKIWVNSTFWQAMSKNSFSVVHQVNEEAPEERCNVTNLPKAQDPYQTSPLRRQIGLTSAVFLIFNCMIGTGIFVTPSKILVLSGSVGLSLFLWVVGAVITAAGMAVYMEFGTGIPRNGGEKNYLEYVYRKPQFLTSCLYSTYVVLLGEGVRFAGSRHGCSAANSVVFGEYVLNAAQVEVTRWNQRIIGLVCITCALLIHGLALKWGLWLQNILGLIKFLIICLIVVSGSAALAGALKVDRPNNFKNAFEGTTSSAYGVVTALYNIVYSFFGYKSANAALSETNNPVRTLKIAAPLALGVLSTLYILTNVAYFAAVPKEEIVSSGRVVAASFFRNVFGPHAERALSVFIALSAFGNVLSIMFSQSRVIQELGREGIVPFSAFLASNKPFNAPLAALFEHWVISVIIMLVPPPGNAFNLILHVVSYPLIIINAFVALALIHIYFNRTKYNWNPPYSASLPVVIFFLISNIYLAICPFVPPPTNEKAYGGLPYYFHCVLAIGVAFIGGIYWLIWAKLMPWLGKYQLE